MTEEIIDQAQEGTQQEQSQGTGEQSEQVNSATEETNSNLVTMPDGRQLTGEQVLAEYRNLQTDYTKKSQTLAELQREREARERSTEQSVRESVGNNPALENVDPAVRELVIQMVTPTVQQMLDEREQAEVRKKEDEAFVKELDALEERYPGGNGQPKFNRDEVLSAMRDPNNRIFDPEVMFLKLKENDFKDAWVKEALKRQAGGSSATEDTGGGPKKPQGYQPKTWEEASKGAYSRL